MRRVRIESHSQDLNAGVVAGIEWVNDSAIAVVDLDYRGGAPFVVLEDLDGVRRGGFPEPHRQRHHGEGVVR